MTTRIRRPSARVGQDGVQRTTQETTPVTPQMPPTVSGGASSVRDIQPGATILDSTVPAVYGTSEVPGVMSWRKKWRGYYYFGFVFSHGEIDAFNWIKVGDKQIYPVSTARGYRPLAKYVSVHLGDGSLSVPTGFSSAWFDANDISAHEDLACAFFAISSTKDLPGGLNVTAQISGMNVSPVDGGGDTNSINVADVAYHIQTDAAWKGVSASRVNLASWQDFGSYCAETMSDALARYVFQGAIFNRDPEQAMKTVLAHAFAHRYHNADDEVCIWHEGPPAAKTGEWSATASATITEDGAAGAATTEFEAGDWILAGVNKAKIESITNDDTIVLDRIITVSGVSLRKLSGVYIKKHNWIKTGPSAVETPLSSVPDEVIVRYVLDEADGGSQYPLAADITGDKRVEMRADGCKSASHARRLSETQKDLLTLQRFVWRGDVDAVAAALNPGDILLFDDDVLTEQLAKVTAISWDYRRGVYSIDLMEFDPNAHSEGVATDDALPSVDVDDPDAPTALTVTFGEAGTWDDDSFIANPDDISGWTYDGALTVAYDGVDDETEITYALADTAWKYGWVDITSDVDGKNVLFLSLMSRWISGYDEDMVVRFEYWSGADHASAARQGSKRPITPYDNDSNNLLERTRQHFHVSNDAHHELRIRFKNTSGGALSADAKFGFKRMRAVAWGTYGENIQTKYSHIPEHVTARLKMYTRFEWTEHGSSEDTVKEYQLRRGDRDEHIDSVVEGQTSLTWTELSNLQKTNSDRIGTGGDAERYAGPFMLAVGPTGKSEEFPIPTEAFEGDAAPPALDYDRTYYAPTTFQDEEPYTWEYFNTFLPDNEDDLDSGVWSDYEVELWVDPAGGSTYVKQLVVDWPTQIGFGYSPENQGESNFYFMPRATYNVATYQIWLKHKYTGLSTQMSLDTNTDGDPSPPALTALPSEGTIERYMSDFEPHLTNPHWNLDDWDYKYRTGTVDPFVQQIFADTPGDVNTDYQQKEITGGLALPLSGSLVLDSEGASGVDDLIGLHASRIDDEWRTKYPIVAVYDPTSGTALGYMRPTWGSDQGGPYPEADYYVYKGNALTTDGDEPTYTSGVKSLTFDGVDDMLRIKGSPSSDMTGTIYGGISFYIRPQIGTAMYLVSQDGTEDFLRVTTGGILYIELGGGSVATGLTMSDNTWHHVTMSWSGAPGSQIVKVWLDGVKGTNATSRTVTSSTNDLLFGCDHDRNNTFEGDLRLLCSYDSSVDFDVTDEDGNARLQAYFSVVTGWNPLPADAKTGLLPALDEVALAEDGGDRSFEMQTGTTVYVRCYNAAREITVKSGDASGNIELIDDDDCVLDDPAKFLVLRYEAIDSASGKWYEVYRSLGASGGGATGVKSILDLYQGAGGTTIANTATDVPWTDERKKDSEFIHAASSAEIEFDFDGDVIVTAELSADTADASSRQEAKWWAMLDTGGGYAEIAGTRAGTYHRVVNRGQNTCSITFFLTVSDGDKIKFQGQATHATNITTLANGSRCVIEKLQETVPAVIGDQITMTVSNDSGAGMSAGQLCYISGNPSGVPQVTLADADAASTSTKMLVMLGETIANGADGVAVVRGVVGGFTVTAGSIRYVSTTAGDQAGTAPSGTGDIVRVIGYAISTTEIYFNPDSTWVKVA